MGIRWSKTQPEGKVRSWHRDNFFLTTDKTYLDVHVVNEIFKSDLMWWNDPLEPPQMRKMLDNCLTMGLYWVPETKDQMDRKSTLCFHVPASIFSLPKARSCCLRAMNIQG